MAFEIYQGALIQSIGLTTLNDEDVKWQYEEINNKVIDWYKNANLRKMIVNRRENLTPRAVSYDAVSIDIEFYYQFCKEDVAKNKIAEANSLYSLLKRENASNY